MFFCFIKRTSISNYLIFSFFFVFLFFSTKVFLILIIWFCVFDFLSFFPFPYTICLGVFLLNRLVFQTTTLFYLGSGILLISQSYHVFLIGLIFFISFCSNLSISSIHSTFALKNSSSISLLIFTSLSFNSLCFNSTKSFSNSKRILFTFKIENRKRYI